MGLLQIGLALRSQDPISSLEYFIDTDPGYGAATQVAITSGTTINEGFTINTSSLSLGFHTLFIRAQNSTGDWGIPESRLIYVDPSGVGMVNIQSLEYFIDDDPGYGSGTAFSAFTSAQVVSEMESINTSSLSTGFHTLFVRAQDDGGGWGIPESRLIYVDPSGTGIVNIQSLEYFIDDDPGYGSGTSFTAFTAAQVISEMESINTSGLSIGFHTLYIRAQAEGGSWGIPESRLIYVDPSGTGTVNIDQLEYFIDDDPGYGSGTAFTAFTAAQVVNETEAINTSSLSIGFHTLFIRARADGGSWGIPESRLIYVDPSGAGMVNVESLEYFFDDDPGYGNGTAFTAFTANEVVSQMEALPTSSLTLGFHRLFVRASAEGGSWGIPESRLVYVDQSGPGLTIVDKLEYFIGDDPGYGNGTDIPVTSGTSINEVFSVLSASLVVGENQITIRARDENGQWGIGETRTFSNYAPSRELDSVSLVSIYNHTDGTNWTNSSNWLSTDIDNWFGVTVSSGRVSALDLNNNSLAGVLPESFGYLEEAVTLDLSSNQLSDSVPSSIDLLINLSQLTLDDNDLSIFPNVTLASLNMLNLDSNALQFGALEPYSSIGTFTYNNQARLSSDLDTLVDVGATFDQTFDVSGDNNVYQWTLGGTTISGATSNSLNFQINPIDTGTYVLEVTNTTLPDLTLSSGALTYSVPILQADSVLLVSLYNGTDGTNWTDNTGWLSDNLANWAGVTLLNDRVSEINLSGNALSGEAPTDLLHLEELSQMNLSNNSLTAIPDLSGLSGLSGYDVSSNQLEFDDLEPNAAISGLVYSPQSEITEDRDTLHAVDETLTFAITTGGTNTYQWTRDGGSITGETNSSLTFSSPGFSDEGTYRLEVMNSTLPDLTLSTGDINLAINALVRDSTALVAFYNALGGTSWTDNSNWLTGNLNTWTGVTVDGSKVTQLALPSNNLQGEIPDNLARVDQLQVVDLSNNVLTGLPDLSSLSQATSIDISANELEFDDLEVNTSLESILTYSPQAELSADGDTLVSFASSIDLYVSTGGANNSYQWLLDNSAISGETNDTISLDQVSFEDEGEYLLQITNSSFPDLTLESGLFVVNVTSLNRDSTALVSLYDNLNGVNWPNQENWLSGTVGSWQGVVVSDDKVVGLNLAGNNLSGTVPSDLLEIDQLDSLNLSGNAIVGLPVLTSLSSATKINISENNIDFGDLEGNESIESILTYSPQANLTDDRELLTEIGEQAVFTVAEESTGASYQWQRDEVDIDGETSLSLTVDDTQFDDEGFYALQATHPNFPDLLLSSGKFQLKVSSLGRDRIALLNIYEATGGSEWTSDANLWPDQDIEDWFGIMIQNNRVVEIDLDNTGLMGELPSDINDIRNLVNVDLASNQLSGIPTIDGLDQLTSLNVVDNLLDFGDLEPNINVVGISYAPQKPFGESTAILSPKGSDVLLDRSVEGSANVYSWTIDGPVASGVVDGVTDGTYTVSNIDYSNMGTFEVSVTNENVPDLTLQSQPFDALATVEISLLPLYRDIDDELTILDEGVAQLHRVTGLGGFDSLTAVDLSGSEVIFGEVVLDDYLISINTDSLLIRQKDTRTDSVRVLPSYYRSSFLWEEADTIFLRDRLEDTLFLQQRPRVDLDGDGEVGLLVESDFLDNEKSVARVEARRKVKRAGCSLRRRRRAGGGRPQNDDEFELVAYKETDDEGRVTFENLPPDTYRLNIEYPGIPMDPNTFIEFEVGANGLENNTLELEATVTEEGIAVELVEELGFLREYFKELKIYPNPVQEELHITYEKLVSNQVTVQVLNLRGQLIQETEVPAGVGRSLTLNLLDLESGIYLLRFVDRTYRIPSIVTYKLIKD